MLICIFIFYFFFFKQKTAYEMRISDWSSDVCSSDLRLDIIAKGDVRFVKAQKTPKLQQRRCILDRIHPRARQAEINGRNPISTEPGSRRSEEHTSELQSLMRISYAVFCLKKKNH